MDKTKRVRRKAGLNGFKRVCTVVPPLGLALALGQIHWAASTRQSYNGERRAAEGGHHEAGCKMPIGGVGFRGHGYV
jgi:hypothetical protein